jgi:type IX secretion system PorP/SprF family membrane protein
MKRILHTAIILLFMAQGLLAQQLPHFSQYQFNNFMFNPAVAGVKDYYQVTSNHRFQWIGITDPPRTNILSINGPHRKLPMGFGGMLYNDVTGPTSRTGLSGAYAYNVEINRDIRISMGLSLGMMQFKIDGSQLTIKNPDDLAIQPTVYSTYVPDAGVGVYAYGDEWYAGFSVGQLFNNKLRIYEQKTGLNKLKSHFYLHGGYNYKINREFKLQSAAMIVGTSPKIFQFDISSVVVYQDMVWGGLSFRYKDAVSVLLGYEYNSKVLFGYSYDIGVTGIRSYNSGTHEIMFGYRFNDIK